MKKTWIKVKRGLLEPKHIERLGVRFFLYLYYLDQADWEEGAVLFYRDRDAADELGIPISTVRKQRVKLEDDEYISCLQKKDHQRITINNWTNPREYSGKVYNQSTQKGKLSTKEVDEGYRKGNHKGIATMGTPSSSSHITNHIKDNNMLSPENEKVFIGFIKTLVGDDISKDIQTRIIKAPKRLDGDCVQLFIEEEHVRDKINKKAQLINDYILPKAVPVFFKSFECIAYPGGKQ